MLLSAGRDKPANDLFRVYELVYWIKVERHNGVTHTFIEQKARIFDQFCLIFINGKEGMIDYREIGLFKGKRDNKMN